MIALPDQISITPPDCCPLCNGADIARLWQMSYPSHPMPFVLWRCRSCGIVFNHPRLPAVDLFQQYDDYYFFHLPPGRRWGRTTQLYVDHLLPMEGATTGRRLLEIGCAGGDLLAMARDRGWMVHGVELSSQAAQRAMEQHDLPVDIGTIEQYAPHLSGFDVVIASDVVEHVPDPRGFLSSIARVLRPGGCVVIDTPNWGSFWRRIGGRRWIGINPFHVFLFDGPCLSRLMRQCGFDILRASSNTNMAHVEWGSRPEWTGIRNRLPAGLRWRMEHYLNRLTPSSFALELNRCPPGSLHESLQRIEQARAAAAQPLGRTRLLGDNLCMVGRRPGTSI